jgi:hypothetical protein
VNQYGGFIFTFFSKTSGPTLSLGGLVRQKSIPTLVDLLMAMTSWSSTSGHVDMTWLLVLAGGAVMIGGNTLAMHGAEAAGGPFAFDGSTKLCHKLGINRNSCGAWCSSAGGDKLLDAGDLLGGELSEGLISRNKIVEHSLFASGATAKASIPEANCSLKDGVMGAQKALPANPALEEGLGRWYSMAAEAEPKVLPLPPEARCSRPMVSWAWARAHCFHAAQVLVAGSWELGVPHCALRGEADGDKERLGGCSNQPLDGDGQAGTDSLLLHVFKFVDVL